MLILSHCFTLSFVYFWLQCGPLYHCCHLLLTTLALSCRDRNYIPAVAFWSGLLHFVLAWLISFICMHYPVFTSIFHILVAIHLKQVAFLWFILCMNHCIETYGWLQFNAVRPCVCVCGAIPLAPPPFSYFHVEDQLSSPLYCVCCGANSLVLSLFMLYHCLVHLVN